MSRCRSCGAAIVWKLTTRGKKIPLDAVPVANGNLLITDDDLVAYALAHPGGKDSDRYVSHFATCPNAAEHRKPREPAPA